MMANELGAGVLFISASRVGEAMREFELVLAGKNGAGCMNDDCKGGRNTLLCSNDSCPKNSGCNKKCVEIPTADQLGG